MMTLNELFQVLDSESELEIINADTNHCIIRGIRGMVDRVCEDMDLEIIHIMPSNITKIWVKCPHMGLEEDFE